MKEPIRFLHEPKSIMLLSAYGIAKLPEGVADQCVTDLLCYGVHITCDGRRVDPNDFYITPEVK